MRVLNKIRAALAVLVCAVSVQAEVIPLSHPDSSAAVIHDILEFARRNSSLAPRFFDGTESGAVTGNRWSPSAGTITAAVNGIPVGNCSFGQLNDLKLWLIEDCDSAEILTGFDARAADPNAEIVLNMIIKERKSFTKKIDMKAFVGAEVGDPALYLQLIPANELPVNKEQINAGEVGAYLKTKRMVNRAGLEKAVMDRWSNGHESQRAEDFPLQNWAQSQNEQTKLSWLTVSEFGSVKSMLLAGGSRVSQFRWDQGIGRYRLYQFDNISVAEQLNAQLSPSLSAVVSGSFSGIAGDRFSRYTIDTVQSNPLEEQNLFGMASVTKREFLGGTFTAKTQLTHRASEYPSADSLIYPVQAGVSYIHRSERIGAEFSAPFQGRIFGSFTPKSSEERVSWSLEGTADRRADAVVSYSYSGIGGSARTAVTGSVRPKVREQKTDSGWIITADRSEFDLIPRLQTDLNHHALGSLGCSVTPFEQFIYAGKDIRINRLVIHGDIIAVGAVRWKESGQVLARRDLSASLVQPAWIRGDIGADYSMFRGRALVTAKVVNIGRVQRDHPQGSSIGPAVVTNLRIRF